MSRNSRLWGSRRGPAEPSTLATGDVVNPVESRVEPLVPRFLSDSPKDDPQAQSSVSRDEAAPSPTEAAPSVQAAPSVEAAARPVEPASGDVDRDVDDLRERLVELQQTVDRLVDRADQPSAEADAAAAPNDEAEARLFTMAKRTADSVIEDARIDAAKILADAERQRVDIIARAREQAEVEFAAERDRVRRAGIVWAGKRAQTMSQLENLRSSFEIYRDGLGDVDDGITEALEALRGASSIDELLDPAGETTPVEPESEPESESEPVIDLRTTGAQI